MSGLSGVLAKISSTIMDRLNNVETEAAQAATKANQAITMTTPIGRYRRIVTTDTAGVYTKTFPANFFATSPVVHITPNNPNTNFEWAYSLSGSVAAGFTVTIKFTQRINSLTGTLTTLLSGLSLIGNPTNVTFSLSMGDQTDDI